jgi:OH-DDVA oxygenase
LNSGSSEILNWVLAAGAMGPLPLSWCEYQPVYRTPAGTGVGVAFAVWGGRAG